MNHPEKYAGQEVVVLGLAKSGVAAAKLFHQLGAKVTVNDLKNREHCPEAGELELLGMDVICGYHPEHLIHENVALVVKNPGIPYPVPPLKKAVELHIEIVTEVEAAYHLFQGRLIAITGSNGKTTTTTLVGQMLQADSVSSVVAGNIGMPMCEVAMESDASWMVSELSSFQLKGTESFRPDIACLLNIYETHLDYHKTMEDYITSKLRIFRNQREKDIAILNADDPYTAKITSSIRAEVFPFSLTKRLEKGVFLQTNQSRDSVSEEWIVYRNQSQTEFVLNTGQLLVRGKHNVENVLAAVAIAVKTGVSLDAVREVLKTFRGVEHRLEFVREMDGVQMYNDSKATNPVATCKSIESFDQGIVLIAGGMDRGSDFEHLIPVFRQHVKALITFGETGVPLERTGIQAGIPEIRHLDSGTQPENVITLAVKEAMKLAETGDVILLSPACASWDMFSSYEERGDMFKKSVHNL